jgi:serine/threonine protein kinase
VLTCSGCGLENRETAKFCGDCGQLLATVVECVACGTENPRGRRFCDECGGALDAPRRTASATPEPITSEPRGAPDTLAGGRYHANIVTVHDVEEEGEHVYLVCQYMAGGDLERRLAEAEGHRLGVEEALSVTEQLCDALAHAHSHGIVHRDLKPGNVWISADGSVQLGDFGLAVALDRTRITQDGAMVGTATYMPPEQAVGGDVTASSDLYSLGAMLYEMVAGRPPFVGDDSVAVISQQLNTRPVAPSWHNSDVRPELEATER